MLQAGSFFGYQKNATMPPENARQENFCSVGRQRRTSLIKREGRQLAIAFGIRTGESAQAREPTRERNLRDSLADGALAQPCPCQRQSFVAQPLHRGTGIALKEGILQGSCRQAAQTLHVAERDRGIKLRQQLVAKIVKLAACWRVGGSGSLRRLRFLQKCLPPQQQRSTAVHHVIDAQNSEYVWLISVGLNHLANVTQMQVKIHAVCYQRQ